MTCFEILAGVYLTFRKGGKILKTANPIDPQTVYNIIHIYTLENNRQNDCNRGLFSQPAGFLYKPLHGY